MNNPHHKTRAISKCWDPALSPSASNSRAVFYTPCRIADKGRIPAPITRRTVAQEVPENKHQKTSVSFRKIPLAAGLHYRGLLTFLKHVIYNLVNPFVHFIHGSCVEMPLLDPV
jgi:hypothetical protein